MKKLIFLLFSLLSVIALITLSTVSCQVKKSNTVTETDGNIYGDSEISDNFYKITFVDGNKVLETQVIEKGKTAAPLFPKEKAGYNFIGWHWNGLPFDFSKNLYSSAVLTAVWELNYYSAHFIADDKIVHTEYFTVKDTCLKEPDVPEKQFYYGCWENYKLGTSDIKIHAIYTPIVYEINYYADNTHVTTLKYSVTDVDFTEPQVPEIFGFDGYWKLENVNGSTVTMIAAYKPKQFTVIFKVNGKEISIKNYNFGEKVEEPQLPQVDGYTASWQHYELSVKDITVVEAVYTPITYYAKFFVNGKLEHTLTFDVENQINELPPVPEREGYSGCWEDFDFTLKNLIINAVYTPIKYTATFIADGKTVAVISFNIENMNIIPPPIAPKDGYICKWENFTVELKNFEVNAIYTPANNVGFIFELTEDKSAYLITNYVGHASNIVIPQSYNNLSVIGIGKYAFKEKSIQSIEISSGIEQIQHHAFEKCTELKEVTMYSVKTIESYAFEGCSSLVSIKLPESMELICPYAFEKCAALEFIEFEKAEGWFLMHNPDSEKISINKDYFSDSATTAKIYKSISTYYLINRKS